MTKTKSKTLARAIVSASKAHMARMRKDTPSARSREAKAMARVDKLKESGAKVNARDWAWMRKQ
jgi:hypothetical protein